MQGTNVKTTL